MDVRITRVKRLEKVTIGRLGVNGRYVCDTLEDKDRGLKSTDTLDNIRKVKVKTETAIPTGRYVVDMRTYSPRFGAKRYYKDFCGGYLPRLRNVKGFDGVLIHRGVNETHTEGCVLVGKATSMNTLSDSQRCFEELYGILKGASDKGEAINLTIE